MRRLTLLCLFLAFGCSPYKDSCDSMDFSCWPLLAYFAAQNSRITFVAAGTNCTEWTSLDGNVWNIRANPFPGCTTGGMINGLAYGGGTFVAVGTPEGTSCGLWSGRVVNERRIDWTQRSCGSLTLPLTTVAFGSAAGSSEFATGGGNSGAIFQMLSSTDGINWVNRNFSDPGSSGTIARIAFLPQPGIFALIKLSIQGVRFRSMLSAWDAADTGSIGICPTDIAVGEVQATGYNRMFIYGRGGCTNQGLQYTDNFTPNNTNALQVPLGGAASAGAPSNSLVSGPGKRVIALSSNCQMDYSTGPDGLTFHASAFSMSACSGIDFNTSMYAADRFFAGGLQGAIFTSSTGISTDWVSVNVPASSSNVQAFAARILTGPQYVGE